MGNQATAEAIPSTVVGGILAYKEPKAFLNLMQIGLIVVAVLFVIGLIAMLWLTSRFQPKGFALVTSPLVDQQSNDMS